MMIEVFQKHFSEVIKAIDLPEEFANDFFAEKLIKHWHQRCGSRSCECQNRSARASELMRAVEKKVRTRPQSLHKVLLVLHRHVTTKELAEEMAKEGNNVDPNA